MKLQTLRQAGAVNVNDCVDIDTGAVIFSAEVLKALYLLISTEEKYFRYRLHLRAGGTSLFQPYFQTDGRDQSFGVQGEMAAGEQ